MRPFLSAHENSILDIWDAGSRLSPPLDHALRAFQFTDSPLATIVGFAPYGIPGDQGLAFGHTSWTPALDAIREVVKAETGQLLTSPTLEDWARQGVRLVNLCPASDRKTGKPLIMESWIRHISDRLIESQDGPPQVFMFWGVRTWYLEDIVDTDLHLVLKADYPLKVGVASERDFRHCAHFSKANKFLQRYRQTQIRWGTQIRSSI